MIKAVKRFLKGEEGVTAIEYGLIAAGIAIAIVAVVFLVGNQINQKFTTVYNCLTRNS
ncbi:MAG: Flp family type IVb pilin [Smithella sp.]